MRNKRSYYLHLLFMFKSPPRDRISGLSSRYNVCVYSSLLNPHYEKWILSQYNYNLNIQTLFSALIDRYSFVQTSCRNSRSIYV